MSWPKYIIKDNFLTDKHFELAKKLQPHLTTQSDKWNLLRCVVKDNKATVEGYVKSDASDIKSGEDGFGAKISDANDIISEEEVLDIHNTYHAYMIKILKDLAPEKVKLYQFSEISFINTGKDYSFHIHKDTPTKLLSGVIYISPEKNEGTWLYDNKEGDNPREIEWKQNRGFLFSATKESWHSYKADGKNDRLALVYNLRYDK